MDHYGDFLTLDQLFLKVAQVAVANQTVAARHQLYECAEVGQTHHFAGGKCRR